MAKKHNKIVSMILDERKKQGITYRELAKRIGVQPATIVNWKNGSEISLDNADKALKELGLSATIGKE